MQNLVYWELSVRRTLMDTKLKLYSYIGIGKYLGLCQNFSAKLKLKTQLDVVKYSLRVQ